MYFRFFFLGLLLLFFFFRLRRFGHCFPFQVKVSGKLTENYLLNESYFVLKSAVILRDLMELALTIEIIFIVS